MEDNYSVISDNQLNNILTILERKINETTDEEELYFLIVNLKNLLKLATAKTEMLSNNKSM